MKSLFVHYFGAFYDIHSFQAPQARRFVFGTNTRLVCEIRSVIGNVEFRYGWGSQSQFGVSLEKRHHSLVCNFNRRPRRY